MICLLHTSICDVIQRTNDSDAILLAYKAVNTPALFTVQRIRVYDLHLSIHENFKSKMFKWRKDVIKLLLRKDDLRPLFKAHNRELHTTEFYQSVKYPEGNLPDTLGVILCEQRKEYQDVALIVLYPLRATSSNREGKLSFSNLLDMCIITQKVLKE